MAFFLLCEDLPHVVIGLAFGHTFNSGHESSPGLAHHGCFNCLSGNAQWATRLLAENTVNLSPVQSAAFTFSQLRKHGKCWRERLKINKGQRRLEILGTLLTGIRWSFGPSIL